MAFCHRPKDFDRARLYRRSDFTEKSVSSWSIEKGTLTLIDIQVEGHAVISSPKDLNISVVSPRFSEIASIVNWNLQKETGQFI